jgi:hypothetical protein
MDVSNGTGEGTDYRTGSGVPKEGFNWTHLPDKKVLHSADPKTPFTIWFRLHSGKIVSASFDQPMASVTLVKTGTKYKINAVKKSVKKPGKTPAPPAKTVKKSAAA